MLYLILASVMLVGLNASTSSAQTCLHGADETAVQRARRDAAIQLATRINLAQVVTLGPAPQSRRYLPLEELTNIPATPPGFDLQFYTDGSTYSFSIKDRLDPCRYAVFSDQDKFLYEAIARRGSALVVPLETR